MSVTDASPTEAADDPAHSPAEGHEPAHLPSRKFQVAHLHDPNGKEELQTDSTTAGPKGVKLAEIGRAGDRVFLGLSGASGVLIVSLVAFVGIFLLALAFPSLRDNTANFLTSREWTVSGDELSFGIAGLLWATVFSSVVAMAIAVPVSVGVALFINQYLHKRIASSFAFVIDLLAAVPSIIFGLWGLFVLAPAIKPVSTFLSENFGWIPIFEPVLSSNGTIFIASIVLAIMIIPIVTAISRDVMAQTPTDHIEAALSLGATRWEVIKTTILPYGRSGIISASMLGLGRALGETIAVMIILSQPAPGDPFTPSLFAGGETFASKIANNAPEFDSPSKTGAYIAAGLVLFILTFAVNAVARVIADRGGAKA